jgi:hypothetical protein
MQKRYWLGRTPDVGALISKILLWPVLFLEVFRAPVIYVGIAATGDGQHLRSGRDIVGPTIALPCRAVSGEPLLLETRKRLFDGFLIRQ